MAPSGGWSMVCPRSMPPPTLRNDRMLQPLILHDPVGVYLAVNEVSWRVPGGKHFGQVGMHRTPSWARLEKMMSSMSGERRCRLGKQAL